MNVLRSLARDLWNVLDVKRSAQPEAASPTLSAVRQRPVPAVLGLSRFRDGFEQFPQGVNGALRTLQSERAARPRFDPSSLRRDGFDAARRGPVDLQGGVRRPAAEASQPAAQPEFSASLDDLAALF